MNLRRISVAAVALIVAPLTVTAAPEGGKPLKPGATASATGGDATKAGDKSGDSTDEKKPVTTYDIIDREAKTKVFTFDYGVPTSPALKLSGLSADSMTSSTSLKPFVLSLPSFLDGAGTGQAVALDFSPVAGLELTWGEYLNLSPFTRALARSRINLVGYRGVEDADATKSKKSKVGLGWSASLLDYSDPAMTGWKSQQDPVTHKAVASTYWSRCADLAINKFIPARVAADSNLARRGKVALQLTDAAIAISAVRAAGADPDKLNAAIQKNAARIDSLIGSHFAGSSTSPEPTPTAGPAPDQGVGQIVKLLNTQADKYTGDDRTLILAAAKILQSVKPAPAAAPAAPPAPAKQAEANPAPGDVLDKLVAARDDLNQQHDALAKLTTAEATKEAADQGFTEQAETCNKRSSAEAFAQPALDVGVGALWGGDPGEFKHFDNGGGALWVGGKWPFYVERDKKDKIYPDDEGLPVRAWSIGGSARYAWREDVATGDKTTPSFSANTLDIWAGFEALSASSRFAVQYGRFKADARDDALSKFSQSGDRWLATAGFRISDPKTGLWANLTYGTAQGTTTNLNDTQLLVTISVGPVDAPELFKPK